MLRKIVPFVLIFLCSIVIAQTDSIRGNQFELKGRIINDIYLSPHCGIFAWGTVIEFEIIEFSDLDYERNSIGVVFTCPEFYENGFFDIGKIYNIKIADENQSDFLYIIPNDSKLAKYQLNKTLWVITADKIE